MSETPSQDSENNVNDSPGKMLARRREQLNLPLNDVARALNLRPAVIEGLENDDYSEIPVATYRRGYLRAYAKYLAIDEREVLDAYRARYGEGDIDRKVTPVTVTKPPSRLGAWLFKLVTLLIIVALIAVTVMWWQSRGGSELPNLESSSTMNDPVEQDGAGGGLTDEPALADDPTAFSSEPEAASEPDPTTSNAAARDDAMDNEVAAEGSTNDTETNVDPADPTLLDDNQQADQATGLAATDNESDDNANATSDDANADTDSGDVDSNRLTLTFNEQSWTEIIDANNQRVLVGLQQPGTSAEVEGQAPFRLTVGNVTGVEMRYQGEAVDLTSRAGANNVARFTLGE
ncbi:RodZ domain-containing protein [Vreelandella arcis]|uniref:Cytoskeleton protein RodZ n=1 Tax=Vreelandella arcis TaxID=416873 RepID=A0A1H0BH42_9GAMM|nr:RodZ domain-containing protein [Halomonas arcis]SDN44950.1 cytoskeleton protein RodZ [Halomonas arcis]